MTAALTNARAALLQQDGCVLSMPAGRSINHEHKCARVVGGGDATARPALDNVVVYLRPRLRLVWRNPLRVDPLQDALGDLADALETVTSVACFVTALHVRQHAEAGDRWEQERRARILPKRATAE